MITCRVCGDGPDNNGEFAVLMSNPGRPLCLDCEDLQYGPVPAGVPAWQRRLNASRDAAALRGHIPAGVNHPDKFHPWRAPHVPRTKLHINPT